MILRGGGQVCLISAPREHQLPIKPESWPGAGRGNRVEDRKIVGAMRTGRLGSFGRATLRVKLRFAAAAGGSLLAMQPGENVAAGGAQDLDLRLAARIGVSGNHPGREEIDRRVACETGH